MASSDSVSSKPRRLHFLDNLRTAIILLVVAFHAAGVYESSGAWSFWLVQDPATNEASGIFTLILDTFMMGTLFFISGYLAPISMAKKNEWAFVQSKFRRLIVPWAVAVLTLIPIYKFIFLYTRGLPQEHWTTYFYFNNNISQAWLWFLPMLFLFNLLYAAASRVGLLPTTIPWRVGLGIVVAAGIAVGLAFDLLGLRGWTLTPLLDFQRERLVAYFLVFLLGSIFSDQGVFASKPKGKTLYIIVSSIVSLPIALYIFFLLVPYVAEDGILVSRLFDRLMYWLGFYLTALSMVYLMVETFRRYADRSGAIWAELNRNSYAVYIIHVIVIGVIGTLLLQVAWPSVVKMLVLIGATYVVSNLIASLYRRLTTSRRPETPRSLEVLGSRP